MDWIWNKSSESNRIIEDSTGIAAKQWIFFWLKCYSHFMLQMQHQLRSTPPPLTWADAASSFWSSSPSGFYASGMNTLSGSPFNLSDFVQCSSQQNSQLNTPPNLSQTQWSAVPAAVGSAAQLQAAESARDNETAVETTTVEPAGILIVESRPWKNTDDDGDERESLWRIILNWFGTNINCYRNYVIIQFICILESRGKVLDGELLYTKNLCGIMS